MFWMFRLALCATLIIARRAGAADSAEGAAGSYDPLAVTEHKIPVADLTVIDAARKREIPILVYLPVETKALPVVLFSHGLGGSREGSSYLGRHWAGRGYAAVFLQHPGSDSSVWNDKPVRERLAAMQKAAGAENYWLRVKDVSAVLDQLEVWSKTEGHELCGRLDLKRVGMSGHSFGAVTTQAVSGQAAAGRQFFRDSRIKAAAIMSPSSPKIGSPQQAFASVDIPWMLMTGTEDLSIIVDTDMKSRLAVFPALPAGDNYELVLFDAEHSAFADRALPGDKNKRNPNHHRVILALSTAFWDAYLKNDTAAKLWLDGDGPATVTEEKDRWRKK